MLQKTFRILILTSFLVQFLVMAGAQNGIKPVSCEKLEYHDKIHLRVEPFELADPEANILWIETFAFLLYNSLSEISCFQLHRSNTSMQFQNNQYIIEGNILMLNDKAEINERSAQWSLNIYANNPKQLIWKQILDIDDTNIQPVNNFQIHGIDFSYEQFDLTFLALIKKAIEKSKQLILSKIIAFENNKEQNLSRDILHLMVLPDLKNISAILNYIKDSKNKVVLQAVVKSLNDKGFIIKDLEESLKISQEKRNTRPFDSRDPFDIFIENAPADIIVYVNQEIDTFDLATQANLLLVAKDKYTAQIIAASPLLKSSRRQWTDPTQPIIEALNKPMGINKFAMDLDRKLTTLIKHGRKTELTIESRDLKNLPLDRKIFENKSIAELVGIWVDNHADRKYTKKLGASNRILRIESSFPILSKNNIVQNPVDYGLQLQSYLKNIFLTIGKAEDSIQAKIIGARILIEII